MSWHGLRSALGQLRRLLGEAAPVNRAEPLYHRLKFVLGILRHKLGREARYHPPVGGAPSEELGAKQAEFINRVIKSASVASVLSVGLLSPTVRAHLALAPETGRRRPSRDLRPRPYAGRKADLTLSIGAIATLLDDGAFDGYMGDLFEASDRLVVIYARNFEQAEPVGRTRDRRFTNWIRSNRPDFILVSRVSGAALGFVENGDPSAREGTYHDFYIYKKLDAERYPPPPPPTAALSVEAEAEHRALGTLRFDIATVIYNDDLPLLRVQARSFARHFSDAMVGSLIYCINEKKPGTCEKFIRDTVIPLLGVHAPKVRFLYLSDIGPSGNDGWLTQQACKLAAADLCSCDYYLVLDAKHHLLRPVTHDDLFDGGRARKPLSRAREDQRPWLADSLTYFGADPAEANAPSPASAPPFMMHVRSTRDMVAEIVGREGKNLAAWFCEKSDRTTEFTLYFAFLVANATRDRFLVKAPSTTASLRISLGTERRERLEEELRTHSVWCFSIHRRRLSKLSVEDRYFIVQTWVRSGLFPTETEAFEEISRLKRHFVILKGKEDKRRLIAEERSKRAAEIN